MLTGLIVRIGGVGVALLLGLVLLMRGVDAGGHIRLPDCDLINQFESGFAPSIEASVPSADGRLILAADGTRLLVTDGEQALHLLNANYDLLRWATWSPTAPHLMVVTRCERLFSGSPWVGTYLAVLYDFSDGLAAYTLQVVPLQVTSYLDFVGWSPDGEYFILQGGQNVLTIWSAARLAIVYQQPGRALSGYWWAADSAQVAFASFLPAFNPEHGVDEYRLQALTLASASRTEYPLAPDYPDCGATRALFWSPAGDAFAHAHACTDVIRLDLYQVGQGSRTELGWRILNTSPYLSSPDALGVEWVGDSLAFWEIVSDTQYRYQVYSFASDTLETRLWAARPPFYPSQVGEYSSVTITNRDHFALFNAHEDGSYSIDLAAADALKVTPFVHHADDLGNPYWHTSGERLAAVYAEETAAERIVRVAWMNHDGSGYGEYEDRRYIDYQDLLWSGDGTGLLFNAIHDDLKFDVLLLDVTTGAVHVVGERLAARLNTRADDPVAAFTFAWLSEHGRWGYGGFAADGAPVFRVDTGVHWIGRSRAFWSPDLRHVAVKMGTGWGEWLVVAERDTRRYDIVSYGLSGLGDPVWQGADELYFTQSINWGPVQDVTYRVE